MAPTRRRQGQVKGDRNGVGEGLVNPYGSIYGDLSVTHSQAPGPLHFLLLRRPGPLLDPRRPARKPPQIVQPGPPDLPLPEHLD